LKFIPYTGKIDENRCMAMKKNDGLYNQCVKPNKNGSNYCTVCQKQADKNDNGKPNDGDIRDEYTGIRVKLGDIIAKGKVSKEAILEFAELNDFEIPEEEFELTKKARKTGPKRKQKDEAREEKNIAEVSDTDEEKSQKVIEEEEKPTEPETTEPETTETEPTEKEKVEDQYIEEKKVEEKPKKKRGRKQKKATEDTENKPTEDKEENKPKKRGRPKKQEPKSVDKLLKENEEAEDGEEEKVCDIFNFQGKRYLKDVNNIIYDFKTEEAIGKYDPEENDIILC